MDTDRGKMFDTSFIETRGQQFPAASSPALPSTPTQNVWKQVTSYVQSS